MFIGLWMLTGTICFLLIEAKGYLENDELDLIDFAGCLAFGIGGYIVAWPYCLYCVVTGEVDESEED